MDEPTSRQVNVKKLMLYYVLLQVLMDVFLWGLESGDRIQSGR